MTSILVNGCAGFIGSNFVPYLLEKDPEYFVVNLYLLTYAGDLANLTESEDKQHYNIIKATLRNRQLVDSISYTYDT